MKKYRVSKASKVYAVRLIPENHSYLIEHADELRAEARAALKLVIDNHKLSKLPELEREAG